MQNQVNDKRLTYAVRTTLCYISDEEQAVICSGARAIVSRVRAYQIYEVVAWLRRKIRWPRPVSRCRTQQYTFLPLTSATVLLSYLPSV